jgi:hypothetical protein
MRQQILQQFRDSVSVRDRIRTLERGLELGLPLSEMEDMLDRIDNEKKETAQEDEKPLR